MKIGIIGCTGRMGRVLLNEIFVSKQVNLSGGTVKNNDPYLGKDISDILHIEDINIKISNDNLQLIKNSDAVIDFTNVETSLQIAKLTAQFSKIHVCGTTGFDNDQMHKLTEFAKDCRIVWSSNMSIGINLLNNLVEQVAATLDDNYEIEIVEMHHNKKIDAPSGTALTLGKYAAKGRNINFDDNKCMARDGIIGQRPANQIGFSTIRGGDVIGDHTVIFSGPGERIELTHKASNRTIYARGAIKACLWAMLQNNGLYNMSDVLLKESSE
ncbi:MAG: 4-hydroxy-tetrahydrodipicolinate reductase [Pseudomonadota bacterium]